MKRVFLFGLFSSLPVLGSALCTDKGAEIGILHDPHIPNFVRGGSIEAIKNGPWSDPSTWNLGRVPAVGDIVKVCDKTVTYDVESDEELNGVGIQDTGKLIFRTDVNTRLTVLNFVVLEGGELQIGSPANPVLDNIKAEVVFVNRPLDLANDPGQYGNGLIVKGKMTVHGAAKTSKVRLTQEALKGMTSLAIEKPVTGWRSGDRLMIADTRFYYENDIRRCETFTLAVAAGNAVTLQQGLVNDHHGAVDDEDGPVVYFPHIGNLTRNVVFRSAEPHGVRGHVIFLYRADIDVRYALFHNLARTNLDLIDRTTWDAAGNVTHVGTNQLGRYPVHFHHVIGPATPPANGHQFTFQGNAVDNGDQPHRFRWGIAIHDSHYGLVDDNVLYNIGGAGIMTEEGNEAFNVISNNFLVNIIGSGAREDSESFQVPPVFGGEGAGIWIAGPMNYVRHNVVCNAETYAYTIMMLAGSLGTYPSFPGADPTAGQTTSISPLAPLLEFSSNEAYGRSRLGLTVWGLGANITEIEDDKQESVIKDFFFWHVPGFFAYPNMRLTFDGAKGRGDWYFLQYAHLGSLVGLSYGDYLTAYCTIKNSDIRGFRTGIPLPVKYGGVNDTGTTEIPFLIENSYFKNYNNIYSDVMFGVTGGGEYLSPAKVIVRNCKFDHPKSLDGNHLPFRDLYMGYFTQSSNINLIQPYSFYFYDYNQQPGNNFQVFAPQQHPDFVVPKTGSDQGLGVASPEEGLTNQQNWDKYARVFNASTGLFETVARASPHQKGVAIRGAIASCLHTDALFNGFTCPIPDGINQPPVVDAGPDQIIVLPNNQVALSGHASDDGLPDPPHALTAQWVKSTGPGNVTFADASQLQTTAAFSDPGHYVLRLSADDGEQLVGDTLTVDVVSDSGQNDPPVVDAGPDVTVTLPAKASLNGSATDDGFPIPPGKISFSWLKAAGPGPVTFQNLSLPKTNASFQMNGTYILRLLASDGQKSSTDDVQVTVFGGIGGGNGGGGPSGQAGFVRRNFNPSKGEVATLPCDSFKVFRMDALIAEVHGTGSSASWNGRNKKGKLGAAGVYTALCSDGRLEKIALEK